MTQSLFSQFISNIQNEKFSFFDITFQNKPIFDHFFTSDQSSNILFIYGDNCSGKSFITKLLSSIAVDSSFSIRSASMANRTANGLEKNIIYGDESQQSTGDTSLYTSLLCIDSTLDQDINSPALAILDEPDLGLSRRYSKALGTLIANKANQMKQSGIVVISHNFDLFQSIINEYKKPISMIGINTNLPYPEWFNNQQEASLQELLNLKNIASQKWIAIDKFCQQ